VIAGHQRMDRNTCIHSFVECLWSICWTTVCPGIWWSQNSRPSGLPVWAVWPTCAK
uniref:Uncharacterized protein n=1 Tax=Aegilops tauschii subsp. strangulata TaxID=200361 RepID=A0A453SJL9_AEGTS